LRTSQTRRNAACIVHALNRSLVSNPIYAPQSTLETQEGLVWRLPLTPVHTDQKASSPMFALRDPLTVPREEEEDVRRLDEGRRVAQAIAQARREMAARHDREIRWSDIMLLVKKRTYLSAYERALREAGIPFVSDKRGGLLESPEVADLIALLTFLITPGDSRALAHVLKSPIVDASDDDLIGLAQRTENTWWLRMRAAAHGGASEAIRRGVQLLEQWLAAAPGLPVHDLLDKVLHQGELIARYAQVVPPLMRNQVIGNIEAFTELALNLDAGRYPSLPKFIDTLRALKKGKDNDAPDEANIDAAADAVRILTIHSAKGLEAPIVVLLDANHSAPARDDVGILCDWPQDADAPTHFSAFGRKDERGIARDALFAAEERFKTQEDWNLLYVAATRAKEMLIVSGIAGSRGALADGTIDGSWYHRLQTVPEIAVDAAPPRVEHRAVALEPTFALRIFAPPPLVSASAHSRVALHDAVIEQELSLHAALEKLTQSDRWPICVPDAQMLARWVLCSDTLAAVVRKQAMIILSQPELERFFNPDHYRMARNAMEIMTDGELLRFDRMVMFDNEIWVLNYKRDLLDAERTAYRAQMARSLSAAQAAFPDKRLRGGLITADGRLWPVD
jgi:ATP-dependent helicase/nuclease subunit A